MGPGGEDVQKSLKESYRHNLGTPQLRRGSICGVFGTTPGGLAMGKKATDRPTQVTIRVGPTCFLGAATCCCRIRNLGPEITGGRLVPMGQDQIERVH